MIKKKYEKILVLGSNSFSGSNFVHMCLKMNKKVIGISRSKQPSKILLPYHSYKKNSNFKFYRLNLNNDLKKILKIINNFKPEAIINFSAQGDVRHSWNNPDQWYKTNCMSVVSLTSNLINKSYLKKYIAISTPEVFGSSEKTIKESNFFNPSTPYAASKLAGDLHLITLFKKYNFPVVFSRSSNVYGPYQQLYRIIPKTIINLKLRRSINLHGRGKTLRGFIHIKDVSNAIYKILNKGKLGESYNISTKEKQITIFNLVRLICGIMNKDFKNSVMLVNENFGQDYSYVLNSTKIRKALNWSEKYNLKQGINETIKWIDDNWKDIVKMPHNYIHKI